MTEATMWMMWYLTLAQSSSALCTHSHTSALLQSSLRSCFTTRSTVVRERWECSSQMTYRWSSGLVSSTIALRSGGLHAYTALSIIVNSSPGSRWTERSFTSSSSIASHRSRVSGCRCKKRPHPSSKAQATWTLAGEKSSRSCLRHLNAEEAGITRNLMSSETYWMAERRGARLCDARSCSKSSRSAAHSSEARWRKQGERIAASRP
mmetsp:Transcript_16525/g.41666  ORF Transcript_16525/g.41666 Transcript_16525/m.41666 type:complete len:207 (+) Transcript_16525:332-952(+)